VFKSFREKYQNVERKEKKKQREEELKSKQKSRKGKKCESSSRKRSPTVALTVSYRICQTYELVLQKHLASSDCGEVEPSRSKNKRS